MTQPNIGAEHRLHGMMHRLLAHMAQRVPPKSRLTEVSSPVRTR